MIYSYRALELPQKMVLSWSKTTWDRPDDMSPKWALITIPGTGPLTVIALLGCNKRVLPTKADLSFVCFYSYERAYVIALCQHHSMFDVYNLLLGKYMTLYLPKF